MRGPSLLARLVDRVRDDPELAGILADAIAAGGGLDEALGIVPGPLSDRVQSRDELIRHAAATFLTGDMTFRATQLAARLASYRRTAWKRDRFSLACPLRHRGVLQEYLWHVLRLRDLPLAADSIRKILAGE